MRKRIGIVILAVLCAAVMAGCFCEHEWIPANCTDPSICSLCEATEGEPLGHSWVDADCVTPMTCSVCTATEGEPLGHTWADADCVTPQTCTVCAAIEGEPLGHSWADATCVEPRTCTVCAVTEGEPLGHTWAAATCTVPETCEVCGETQGETLAHTWSKATCLAPQTCQVCGKTQGEKGGHSWADATCEAPKTCKLCGKTKGEKADHDWKAASCAAPETCRECGLTRGKKLKHTWTDATCTMPKTCEVCGKTKGEALGHDWKKNGNDKTCQVCGATSKTKYIAITFDDGPSGKYTRTLLAGLKERGVKATFFLCGYRMETYPGMAAEIAAGGHELALHTMNHEYLHKLSKKEIRKELENNLAMMPEGSNITLMRPPGGFYNDKVKAVCEELGLSIIMWSVDPQDWATNNAETIKQRILNQASAGDIILLHDMSTSSVEAALAAIDELRAQGYEFVTVSQLAKLRGKSLKPGKVYSGF